MQLEPYTPPPEPEEPEEEPEEVPVTHLGVSEYEKRENYLTEKHITASMFKLINKLDKNHPTFKLLNRNQKQQMSMLFKATGRLYHLINDIEYMDHRNNVIFDMFKNVNRTNVESIINKIYMDNSKIYLHYEQTGEIIEPETPENNRTVPTTAPIGVPVGVPRGYPAVAPIGKHTHNIKDAID